MVLETGRINRGAVACGALQRYLESGLALAVIATAFFLPVSEGLKNIAFLVALALYIGVIFVTRQRIYVPLTGWLLLGFLGAAMLSAAVSAYPWKAVTGVWDVFRYTSFFFIVGGAFREERHVPVLLWAAVTGLGLTALVGAFRYLDQPVMGVLSLGVADAAVYAVMGLALMFGMSVQGHVAGWRLIWLIVIATLSVLLLGVTHARMVWGGFVLIAMIVGLPRSVRVVLIALPISVLIVLGVASVNPPVKAQVMTLAEIQEYKTLGGRVEFWKKAIAMWEDAQWLGIGPKTFILHDDAGQNPKRNKYDSLQGSPHNLWLHTGVEMGWVGVIVLAGTFAYLGFWLIRRRGRFASSWPAVVWDGAFGSWLVILVSGLTDPSFGREPAMFFLMLLALLHTGVSGRERSHSVA